MNDKSPLWLVVNSASGSFSDDAVAQLHANLKSIRRPAIRTIDCRSEDLPDRAAAEQAEVGMIAVFGGDGTLNACLRGLEGWNGSALLLPGGTANLLCDEMFGERSTSDIVAALGAGDLSPGKRTCIRTGGPDKGAVALAEVLAGPGARWADVREDLRDGEVLDMVTKSVDITQESLTGGQVRVAEPAIGREDGYAGLRLVPQAKTMAVQGYYMDNFSEWFRQGLAIAQRNFREGPHDALAGQKELTCSSTDGEPIELMIDGERETAGSKARFSLAPFALDLLGPAE